MGVANASLIPVGAGNRDANRGCVGSTPPTARWRGGPRRDRTDTLAAVTATPLCAPCVNASVGAPP
eukprot:7361191-Lingulodinium_polyedra.AAC.1